VFWHLSNEFTVLRCAIVICLQGMLSVMIVSPPVADYLLLYIETKLVTNLHQLWKEGGKKYSVTSKDKLYSYMGFCSGKFVTIIFILTCFPM
jgi:hypothetical protein